MNSKTNRSDGSEASVVRFAMLPPPSTCLSLEEASFLRRAANTRANRTGNDACQEIIFESLWRDYFTKSLLIHHLEHVKLQIIGLFCRPQNRVIRCLGAVLDLTQAFVDISCRLMDGLCEQFIGHKV